MTNSNGNAPIITLTTDWGQKDFFAGMVKGRLYSNIPGVNVVDICHGIEPFDLQYASFVVKNACLGFPKGTIHIIDVASVETIDHPFIVVEYKEQYYICTNNGLPHLVFGNEYTRIRDIDIPQDSNFYNFAAYNLFCFVAEKLAKGEDFTSIGKERRSLFTCTQLNHVEIGNTLQCYIAYVDNYGNGYLNITYDEFKKILGNRHFKMKVDAEEAISSISDSYDYSKTSQQILTVSATGQLEIAINQCSGMELLGLTPDKEVKFTFYEK